MPKVKLVIFDIGGTIIEDNGEVIAAFSAALGANGLPASVAEAHARTWIMNRADGMIYHHALTQAAAELDLRVFYFEKDTVLELAAQTRRRTARDLERQLKALGIALGPPWRKGQVLACAGAICAHASAAPLGTGTPRHSVRA